MKLLLWYDDEKLSIEFDTAPCIGVRYVTPSSTPAEKKSIKKFPFINKRELKVWITDKTKGYTYHFIIPKGYCYDGASIPRFFWRVIGSKTDNAFLIAALIHDVLCENHYYVNGDRYLSTIVFERLLSVGGVGGFKRWLMKHSVDNFQKFQGWG
jgi:hypothetical protein